MRQNPVEHDHVFQREGWWYARVDGRTFGAWRSQAEAKGGLEVEQRRAVSRQEKVFPTMDLRYGRLRDGYAGESKK